MPQLREWSNESSLPKMKLFPRLQKLYIVACPELISIPAFKGSNSLQELAINDCGELTCLPEGVLQPTLLEIDIRWCPKLITLHPIDETEGAFNGLTSLQQLLIYDCQELITLPEGMLQPTLLKIDIRRCPKLKTLNPIDESEVAFNGSTSLQQLVIHDCPELITLPAWVVQPTLIEIDIRQCPKLKTLNPIDESEAAFNGSTSLQKLVIYDCSELITLPDSPPESMSTEHEGVMSVPGVEVSTSSETGHQQAEIAINEKVGEWNESGQIDKPIMSIPTSTEGLMKLELLILPPARASEKTVPGVEASTTHIPYIAIDSPPESMSTEHEVVMSVPGVEVSTTVSEGHQLAEIAINEKEGEWNESGQIDRPIMSITTSTEGLMKLELFILPPARSSEKIVMHRIIEDGSFSLRESDYSVFSRKNENLEEPVQPEENEGKFEEKWWRPSLILLMKNKLSSLPEKPNCPNLQGLFLQNNTRLRRIPSSFFDDMPKLQFLDMSKTGVRKLPASLSKLSELKALFLCNCDNIDELPVEIGNLERIEVLDLWGTQLLNLPNVIAKLSHLRLLRVSFYGADDDLEYPILHPLLVSSGIISKLRALQALSIAVRPGDGRWNKSADAITKDVASLGELTYLQFYFPEVKFLALFMQKSLSWRQDLLRKFKFVLGQDIERIVSRVPDDIISEYEKHDRCLRYVNGDEKIPQELEELLVRITAFYLDHHCTVKSLSEFGLTNLKELKFCVLRECPNIVNIINNKELKFCVLRECPDIVNIINNIQKTDGLLPHLEHLSMHYLPRLKKIWKGVVPLGSLDRLKLLSVRKCPKLKFILTESMLQCLSNLEELIVEDCESVKVIIETKGKRVKAGTILPSLKKMKLSYLPKLGMLWNGADPTFELIVRGCRCLSVAVRGCPVFKSST